MRNNPFERLARFEKKHGDYYDMLSQIDIDITKPGQRELRLNMCRHRNLVSICIGYGIGIEHRTDEWIEGPPPKEENKYWLVEFADGDRFEVVKYVKEDDRFEDQETFGYISDPMIKHLEIPNPGERRKNE